MRRERPVQPGTEEDALSKTIPERTASGEELEPRIETSSATFEQSLAEMEAAARPLLGGRMDNSVEIVRTRLAAARDALGQGDMPEAERLLGEAERMMARFGELIETEQRIMAAGRPLDVSESQWNVLLDGIGAALLDFGTSAESGSQLRGDAILAAAKLYAGNIETYNLDSEAVREERFRIIGFIIEKGQSALNGEEYARWDTEAGGRQVEVLQLEIISLEDNLAGIREQLRIGRISVLSQIRDDLNAQIDSETVGERKIWLEQLAGEVDAALEMLNANEEVSAEQIEMLRARYVSLTTGQPPYSQEEVLRAAMDGAKELRGRGGQSDRNAAMEGTPEWFGQQALLALEDNNLYIAQLATSMGRLERAARNAGGSARGQFRDEDDYYSILVTIADATSGVRTATDDELAGYAATVRAAATHLDTRRILYAYSTQRSDREEETRRQRIVSAAEEAERRLSEGDLEGAQMLLRMAASYADLLGEAGSGGWRTGWGGTIGEIEDSIDGELGGEPDAAARFQVAIAGISMARQADLLRSGIRHWGEGNEAYLSDAKSLVEEALGRAVEFAAVGMQGRANDLLTYAALYIDSVKRLGQAGVRNAGCRAMAEALAALPASEPNSADEMELKQAFMHGYLRSQSDAVDAAVAELESLGGELQSATPAPHTEYVPLRAEIWAETHPGVPLEEQPPAGFTYLRPREEENEAISLALSTAKRRAEQGDVRGAWMLVELVRQYYGAEGYYGPEEWQVHRNEGWRYALFSGEMPVGYQHGREAMLGAIEAEAGAGVRDDAAHREAAYLFDRGAQTSDNTTMLIDDYAAFSRQYIAAAATIIEYERNGRSTTLRGGPELEDLLMRCGDAARRGDTEAYNSLRGRLDERHDEVLADIRIHNFGEALPQLRTVETVLAGIRQTYEGAGMEIPPETQQRITELERKRDVLEEVMRRGLEETVGGPPPAAVPGGMEERGAEVTLAMHVEFPAEEYAALLSGVEKERRMAMGITRGVQLIDQQIEITTSYIDSLEHEGREGVVPELEASLGELRQAREFILRGEFRAPEEELPFEATDAGGAEGAYQRAMEHRALAFKDYSLYSGDLGISDLHMQLFRSLAYPPEARGVEAQERSEGEVARLGRAISILESAVLPVNATSASQIFGGGISGGNLEYYHGSWAEISRLVTQGEVPSESSLEAAERIRKDIINTAKENAQWTGNAEMGIGLLASLVPGIGPYLSLAVFGGMAVYQVVDEWDRGHGIGGVSEDAWMNLGLMCVIGGLSVATRVMRFAAMPAEGAQLTARAEALLGTALELDMINMGIGLGMSVAMTGDAIDAARHGDMLAFGSALMMALFPLAHMGGTYAYERATARRAGVQVPLAMDEVGASLVEMGARTRAVMQELGASLAETEARVRTRMQRAGASAAEIEAQVRTEMRAAIESARIAIINALRFDSLDNLAYAYAGAGEGRAAPAPEMPAGRGAATYQRTAEGEGAAAQGAAPAPGGAAPGGAASQQAASAYEVGIQLAPAERLRGRDAPRPADFIGMAPNDEAIAGRGARYAGPFRLSDGRRAAEFRIARGEGVEPLCVRVPEIDDASLSRLGLGRREYCLQQLDLALAEAARTPAPTAGAAPTPETAAAPAPAEPVAVPVPEIRPPSDAMRGVAESAISQRVEAGADRGRAVAEVEGLMADASRYGAIERAENPLDALYLRAIDAKVAEARAGGREMPRDAAALEVNNELNMAVDGIIAKGPGAETGLERSVLGFAKARARSGGRAEPSREDLMFGALATEAIPLDFRADARWALETIPLGSVRDVEAYVNTAAAIADRMLAPALEVGRAEPGIVHNAATYVFMLAAKLHAAGVRDPLSLLVNPNPAEARTAGLVDVAALTADPDTFRRLRESALCLSQIIDQIPEGSVATRRVGGASLETRIPRADLIDAVLRYAISDARRLTEGRAATYFESIRDDFSWTDSLNSRLGKLLVDENGELTAPSITDQRAPLISYIIPGRTGELLMRFLDSREARRNMRGNVAFQNAAELSRLIGRMPVERGSGVLTPEAEAWLGVVEDVLGNMPTSEAREILGAVMRQLIDLRRGLFAMPTDQFIELCEGLRSVRSPEEFIAKIAAWYNVPRPGLSDPFAVRNPRLVAGLRDYSRNLQDFTSNGSRPAAGREAFSGNPRYAGRDPYNPAGRPDAFDAAVPVFEAAVGARAKGPEAFRNFKFSEEFCTELNRDYGATGEELFQAWRQDHTTEISIGGRSFVMTESGSFEDTFFSGVVVGDRTCQDPSNWAFVVSGLVGSVELPWIKMVAIRLPGSTDNVFRRMLTLVQGDNGPVLLVQPPYGSPPESEAMSSAVLAFLEQRYGQYGIEVRDMAPATAENTGYRTFESGRSPLFYMDSNPIDFGGGAANGLYSRVPGTAVNFPDGWTGVYDLSRFETR